jgi:undecaprenyl-diphosphatase
MHEYLITSLGSIGHWGYLVIFLVVMLECQVVLGLFMPGETLVLVGGFFAGQGLLDPGLLILTISSAAIVGDSIGYEVGRQLGRGWIMKHGGRFGLRQEHLIGVDSFFMKHGGKAAFVSHFLHLLRALMPFVAGDRRMPYARFLLFNSTGCIVWASVFVTLGYVAGESWRAAAHYTGFAGKIVIGCLLLAAVTVWIWRRRKRRAAGSR